MPLIKSVGAANRQSPEIRRKVLALYHRNTKIRMRTDELDQRRRGAGVCQFLPFLVIQAYQLLGRLQS